VLTRARYWFLSWARCIQSTPSHPISLKFPSTPRSPKWLISFRFPNRIIVHISHLTHPCYFSRPSHSPWFDHPNNIWWTVTFTLTYLTCLILFMCVHREFKALNYPFVFTLFSSVSQSLWKCFGIVTGALSFDISILWEICRMFWKITLSTYVPENPCTKRQTASKTLYIFYGSAMGSIQRTYFRANHFLLIVYQSRLLGAILLQSSRFALL